MGKYPNNSSIDQKVIREILSPQVLLFFSLYQSVVFLRLSYSVSRSNIKVVFSNYLNIRLCNDFGVFNRFLSTIVLFSMRSKC